MRTTRAVENDEEYRSVETDEAEEICGMVRKSMETDVAF
jgi:hypothetical protein